MARTKRTPSSPITLKTEAFTAWAEAHNMTISGAARFALLPQTQYLYSYQGRQLPPTALLVIAAKSTGMFPAVPWECKDHAHQIMRDLIGDAADDTAVQAFLLTWAKARIAGAA
jgi:hypothetical protein